MEWNDFYKSVKEGRFQSVYLFTGPEELNKKEALSALRKALLPAGLEQLNDVTLENCSAQAIIDCAETMPVMCERRIVVVRDWAPLKISKSKKKEKEKEDSGEENKENADISRMLEWLKDVPDSCIVVFYMTVEADGRKKLFATLKNMGALVEFKYLEGAMLVKWCNQHLKQFGKKLQGDAAAALTMMAGQDLSRISGELKKLAAYTQDAPEITAADVRAVVSPSPEYTVFMILDHLLNGKLADATQVLNSILKSEPYMTTPLITMFANQLRINAHIKYAMESRGNMGEVLSALNITQYRFKHIQQQIRNISADALHERYRHCVDADYDIKSGRVKDRAALDALMLKIVFTR